MSKAKQIGIILLFCVLIAFIIADVIAAIHSTWFIFTHIHLTRIEAIFFLNLPVYSEHILLARF